MLLLTFDVSWPIWSIIKEFNTTQVEVSKINIFVFLALNFQENGAFK
jgi:hypothetical protein